MFFGYFLLVFFIVLFVLLYSYFDNNAKYWQRRGANGPKAYPIIGNLFDNFRMAQNELEEHRLKTYGKVHGVMQGMSPVLTVGDPDLLKQMMITDFRVFMNHRDNFTEDPILGKMMTELKDDEWKRVRSTVSRAFTTSKLKGMEPLINKCVVNIFDYIDSVEQRHEEVNLRRITLAYTLDVIAVCVFGVNTNASCNPYDEFVAKSQELVHFKLWRLLTKVTLPGTVQVKYDLQLFPKKLVNYFVNILNNIINQRKQIHAENVDFVTLLLSAHEDNQNEETKLNQSSKTARFKLTEEEIIGECFAFFTAGFETTATFLQFTLYALAMHPEVQQKLFEEIEQYFKEHEKIEYNSLNALPYFDAVCNESLRLYTPVTMFEHICRRNYKLGDILIEKGVIINLPIYAMHHDSDLFPNHEQFIPERFLPENQHNIKPYSFIPFGLGPRNCIGNRFANYNSKLFLAELVRNFEIMKTKNTPEKLEFTGKFLFLNCKEIFVAIRRRNNTNKQKTNKLIKFMKL